MIIVELGNLNVRASIEGRTWSCENEAARRFLQEDTDELFIHGGIPDADEFIVEQLAARYPLRVLERRPSPDDPEATDADGAGDEEAIY